MREARDRILRGATLLVGVALCWSTPCQARVQETPGRVAAELANDVDATPLSPITIAAAAILESERKPTGLPDAEIVARLRNVGSSVTDSLLDILVSGTLPNSDPSVTAKSINVRQRELLLAALATFHPQTTVKGIENRLAASPTRKVRQAALFAYSAAGSGAHIARIIELAWTEGDGQLARATERAFQYCLTSILTRDPDALLGLAQRILAAPADLHRALLFSIGATRDSRGQEVLLQVLKMRPELADIIVAQARLLGAPLHSDVRDSLGQELLRYVDPSQPELCSSALRALAEIGEEDAVPLFLEFLGHEHRSIREGALWSLRRISRLALSDQAATWRIWYAQQRDWWDGRANVMLRDLDSGKRVARLLALEELSKASIFRDEIVEYVAPLTQDGDVVVRRRACAALTSLGMRAAGPALLTALDDSDVEVRNLARRGLESLFGVVLPEEVLECRALLRL